MKKTVRKLIVKLLVVVLLIPMYGVLDQPEVMTVEAADLPVVNEEEVTERVKELAKLLGVNNGSLEEGRGVLFTANGLACGHPTGETCSNCKNTYVVNTKGNWFEKTFGYTIDPALLPGHYTSTGSVTNSAWTCAGFANFALWYIAKADSTSDVYRDLVGTQGVKFTKANLQKADIRIGDIVRLPDLPHSFMFLGYVGDTGVKVLDCNWVGGDPNKIAQVRIHTISFNSSYSMAITRARNYEPGEKIEDITPDVPIQGKTYGILDLSATSWSQYNVGQNADMYADKAYTIYHGAELEILDKVTNSKGNEVYYVYSPDLGMNCYISAKYVKVKETITDGVVDFVNRMYNVILGRTSDAGSQTWVDGLKSGTFTGAEVAKGFIMSEEFLNKDMTNEEFVKILYSAFFGREADNDGLSTWVGFLNQGYRKSYVFAGFANSTEFAGLCEGYGVAAGSVPVTVSEQQPNLSETDYNVWLFVERMYSEVLGRTPDMNGIRDWVALLKAGTWTGAQVAEGFILSKEFLTKEMTNEAYVRIMYSAFFGREADEGGLKTWVNALETDYSKEYVFAGFANSTEFGTLCSRYGIRQGRVDEK